jgi:hypothetical protein
MLDLEQMRGSLRRHLGMDISDLPDPDADLLLNRSYWEIIDKFNFREKEVTATFSTEVGISRYNMPEPFEALRQISIPITDNLPKPHKTLERMTAFEYENVFVEGETNRGRPEKYCREGCFARLWPTPDKVYTMTIKYWTTLADLASDNAPAIPQVWHEIIVFGAVWRGQLEIGDYARCNQMKAHQINLINSTSPVEAKEEFDTHTGGVEVLGRDYP